ncbi:Type II secretory pathway, component PulK [Rubritalea squalenifaciens DSM 18772]|uniref:Type II secretory pathway, component PulK n=1 Tax=Rubritalea squalenifaciens DSM 18772 TaxID=1123071 RepID=A0A1M6H0N7_9BACT|nr:type II secretion system protein GspK [Rubritalea squalenifaciens]SHJ15769.1 Type II secretory pathway, component PulK [Rubritalea squalenifaciens DSM 18772]
MMQKNTPHQQRGFALVAVLWVILILSGIMVATLSLVKVEADTVSNEVNSYQALMEAHTGLSYAVHPGIERDDPILAAENPEYDAAYKVLISPEAVRFNINTILQRRDKALMRNIFKHWGMEENEASSLTDALIDWVDRGDTAELNGAEKSWYEEQGFTDRPYNGPFTDIEDMRLVKGFWAAEKLRSDWRDWFTLRSEGGLDIHEAKPELIAVAAEINVSEAEDYQAEVKGDDGLFATEDDRNYPSVDAALTAMASPGGNRRAAIAARFVTKGNILRIESVGRSGNFQASIIATVQRQGAKPNILDYQERISESE